MTKITACQYIGPNASSVGACNCSELHEGSSYCETHYYMLYQKGTARAKRHKDIRVANAIWDWQSEFDAAVAELVAEGVL